MSRRVARQSEPFPLPFMVLDENRFAFAAVTSLLDATRPQPAVGVLIYGPSGCGKSHLADFVTREMKRQFQTEVTHLAASDLLIEDAESLERQLSLSAPAPARASVSRRLVVCEDIQSIARQAAAQANLVRIIDDSRRAGCDLLMTSNCSPGDLTAFSAKLRNRLRGGVCASLKAPGPLSRLRLLEHFCSHHQIPLASDSMRLLSKELAISPRELLGALFRFDELARLHRQPLSLSFAQSFLTQEVRPQPATMDAVAKAVCKEFGLNLPDVRSQSRDQQVKTARQCAMYLVREIAGEKLTAIGEYFGNRSHSTVLHACHRIEASLSEDAKLRQQLEVVRQRLAGTRT